MRSQCQSQQEAVTFCDKADSSGQVFQDGCLAKSVCSERTSRRSTASMRMGALAFAYGSRLPGVCLMYYVVRKVLLHFAHL